MMETIPVGRVKTKRRNPFGDEYYREQKTIKNDMEIIYGIIVLRINSFL